VPCSLAPQALAQLSSGVTDVFPSLSSYALRMRSRDEQRRPPPGHLRALEAESIAILRETAGTFNRSVLLYSIGKDSTVLLHLALKAFWPAPPPFTLLHVDSLWEFQSMAPFRDALMAALGLSIVVHVNQEGAEAGTNPFVHGSSHFTDVMRTQALLQALRLGAYDGVIGGARRDEERSRAKERIFSIRSEQQIWDPRRQRPELWRTFNTRLGPGESMRVFPLSNWTELDIWSYIAQQEIPVVPLYYAAVRPFVERAGALLMVDDSRLPLEPGEAVQEEMIRFRTLGCYPLTGAVRSNATSVDAIVEEMLETRYSERHGRLIDFDDSASMEKKKREGYF